MEETKKKIKIVTIKIIKETEDLRPDAVEKNGKKKILKPGHKIMGYDYVVEPFLKAKVAEKSDGNEIFNKTQLEKN